MAFDDFELGDATEAAEDSDACAARLIDALQETWIVVRIDRAITDDEERELRELVVLMGRDALSEVWLTRPNDE